MDKAMDGQEKWDKINLELFSRARMREVLDLRHAWLRRSFWASIRLLLRATAYDQVNVLPAFKAFRTHHLKQTAYLTLSITKFKVSEVNISIIQSFIIEQDKNLNTYWKVLLMSMILSLS